MGNPLFAVVDQFNDGDVDVLKRARPLRGRVLLEIESEASKGLLWTPEPKARSLKIHTGRVLSFGAPAQRNGVDQPHGFVVGDRVLFVFAASLEKSRRFAGNLCFCAQEEIQAVLEPDDPPST